MPASACPRGASNRERLAFFSMPEPNSGCLLWIGSYNSGGYGRVTCEDGRRLLAHRVAWMEEHGQIPDGLGVLHYCDVPPCINVDHLFLGTQADNDADMWAKGRGKVPAPRRGSTNPRSILTEVDIPTIREDRRILRVIAEEYGVDPSLIWLVKQRKAWGHVP